MNHYLLPYSEYNDDGSNRYGNTSILNLMNKLIELGAKKGELRAKVFGGANILKINEKKVNFLNIGEKNIEMAFKILSGEKIKIVNYDVGGQEARRIVFNTDNFQIRLKKPLHKRSF
ncbi:chemotaxis protein CheD [Candidatus Acidulodesulfobacterium sp. H_13]|uniref:chemotaxis protein CheD n=1 Tax=Candidatus Acidulodesulfobacterium sp. H_13 TaxID=3395470 RepID=UPI003AF868F3